MYLGLKLFENTITHLLRYKVFINYFQLIFKLADRTFKLYIFSCTVLKNLNRNSEFNSYNFFHKICERNKLKF